MAVTTAVLSGTITDVIGDLNPALLGRVVLAIEANTEGSLLLDTSGDRLMAGAKRITVDKTTGAYGVTLVRTDSTDVIPSGVGRLYRAYLQYPSGIPGAGNVTRYSGWFELTADASLSDADKWPGLEVTAVTDALVASIGDMQADVETRHAAVMGVVATNEGIMTSVLGSGGTFDDELSATFAPGVTLPEANGVDDTTDINATLAANPGKPVHGRPGEHYKISAPLVMGSKTTLVMTGCEVTLLEGSECNLVTNENAATPQRSTSDGAATLGSTTITSATAAFTSADVGRSIVLADAAGGPTGLGPLVGKVVSVTNATTVVLSAPAHATVTGKSLKVFDRDRDITVKGGVWHRGNNTAPTALDRHSFYFRHVDNISIDIDRYDSTNGKFCVSLGDVDKYHVTLRDLDTTSDGCHVAGPAFDGEIAYVAGHTVDDLVAFTCNDYPGYNDVAGDILGCKIGAVYPDNSRQAFKILAGAGFHIDGIKADLVKGTTTDNGAWIGDDVANASTTGGTYGSVDVGHLDVQPTGAAGFNNLYLVTPTAERIKAKVRVPATNTLTDIAVRVAGTSAATIKELVLEDCEFNGTALDAGFAHQAASATVERLSIVRPRVGAGPAIITTTGGTIKDAVVTEPNIDNSTGTTAGLYLNGGTVEVLTVVDAKAVLGATAYFIRKNNGTLGRVNIVRGRYSAATGALMYRAFNAGAVTLAFDGCDITSFSRVAQFFDAATVILQNPTINSMASAAFHASGGAVTLIGRTNGTFTLVSRAAAEVINVRGMDLRADVSILAKTKGDFCYNTNAALSCGDGPVVTDGTNWKNLYSGLTY